MKDQNEAQMLTASQRQWDQSIKADSTIELCESLSKYINAGFVVHAENICRELMQRAQDKLDDLAGED